MMADNNTEMLHQAVARNLGAVLSLPSAGMLRHHKSRFLTEIEGGILMEAPANEGPLIAEVIGKAVPCGVSFRNGVFKVMFASPIRRVQAGWKMNAETQVDAVLLEMPTQVKSLQRRANYRVEVHKEAELAMRVWRISDHSYLKEQPVSAQEIKTELRDLSVGGAGVRFIGKDGLPPKVSSEDRLRIVLSQADQKLIIEGKMRAPSTTLSDGSLATGIQFKKLERDLEGRQTLAQLTRIVGELQRDEARRIRLGLAKAG